MPSLVGGWRNCPCSAAVKPESVCRAAGMAAAVPGVLGQLRAAGLIRRGLVLFAVGVVLALVLNLLQIQRNVALFPEEVVATIFSSAWWIPPCCGTAAGKVAENRALLAVIAERLIGTWGGGS